MNSSLLFENGSKEKLKQQMISAPVLESFFEMYASYLFDSRKADNRDECFRQVGALISASMDRGECTVMTMEHLKTFINSYGIKTKRAVENEQLNCLMERTLVAMANNPNSDLLPEMIEKLSNYKKACDDKRRLEMELSTELRESVQAVVSNFVSGHQSRLDSDFGFVPRNS